MIFPGSALRSVNKCGRQKQETSCCADRSDIGRWRSRTCLLRNFVPGDVRGAWQRLAVLARVAVHRTIMGCDEYVAPSKSNSKEAHLTCSKLIQFQEWFNLKEMILLITLKVVEMASIDGLSRQLITRT